MKSSVATVQPLEQLRDMLKREYESMLQPFQLTEYVSNLARGKFFRSHLLLVSAERTDEQTLKRCVALELLHTSTLVHDDIIDQATLRRGKPTLWHALGTEQALLIGNLIATRGLLVAAEDSPELSREFLKAYMAVNQAQQQEVQYRGRLKPEEKYLDIITGKTSAMLELALYAGASLSDEWPCDITRLAAAIRDVGVVFQVKDDIEDAGTWLKQDTGERSKAAQFDIDLQNYTLPVTLAAHSAGLASNEGVTPNQLRAIPAGFWRQSLNASERYADTYLKQAQRQLHSDLHGDCKGLATRVTGWSENFLGYVRKQLLDEAVKHSVQA